jgi:drug/metabolite transporter (DMT)-like permease
MHNYLFPLLAAFGCSMCNGTAAVLQKISADKEKNVQSLDTGFLLRLAQDKPYIVGVLLDILGWLFTLYAVQNLPLFLVEAVIASNIIVTAFLERFIGHRVIASRSYIAIFFIVVGLVMLAIASAPEKASPISATVKWVILLNPLLIGLGAYVLVRSKRYGASIGLAVLGGLAFGGTSVIGRIFKLSHPVWHTLYSPLVFGLIASGTLGILLFSIALQRAHATVINATMTASQTLIPAIVGIAFLGDEARNGLWYLVILGTALSLGGVVALALGSRIKTNKIVQI